MLVQITIKIPQDNFCTSTNTASCGKKSPSYPSKGIMQDTKLKTYPIKGNIQQNGILAVFRCYGSRKDKAPSYSRVITKQKNFIMHSHKYAVHINHVNLT